MRFLNHTTTSPAEDLALEEAIHLAVEEGLSPNTWRLWQAAAPAVILGTGQESALEANLERAAAAKVSVLRRHSGGGAVVIGPGVLNFSGFFKFADAPGSETIQGAMAAILRPIQAVLGDWKIQTQLAGLSDLAAVCEGGALRKIGGNSQARKKHSFVVHGTILADPDWSRIDGLLRFPSSVPDYRAGRGHREFLTSLRELGAPSSLDAFSKALSVRTAAGAIESQPSAAEADRTATLLAEKYSTREWNFRR